MLEVFIRQKKKNKKTAILRIQSQTFFRIFSNTNIEPIQHLLLIRRYN